MSNKLDSQGEIKSVQDLLQILKSNQEKIENNETHLFYRGEGLDYGETSLLAKGLRPDYLEYEYKCYYDMLTNYPDEFEHLTNLSRLAKMQHFSCPTRLLDLTENPLVALYFACQSRKDRRGKFYLIEADAVLNYDSDKALLLACLSHLNMKQKDLVKSFIAFCKEEKQTRIYNKYINRIINGKYEKDIKEGAFQFSRLIGEVVRERPAFMRYNTEVEDLTKNYIVKPLIQNERQRKQEGLFLIYGLNNNFTQMKDINITTYDVVSNKKNEILKELELLGINQASLFCDMEKRVAYMFEDDNAKKK